MARKTWIIGIIVAVAALATTFAAYWPGLYGGFIFDDYPNLVFSDGWRATSTDLSEWRRIAFSNASGPAGRPLALLSFGANYYLTGMNPFWMKLTSLALHLLNGALVWLLCRKIFALLQTGPRLGPFAAALIACAWMLHPLQASTVLYVVQRMEIGALTGVLLSLIAYTHGRTRQLRGLPVWPWLLIAMAAMLVGFGFKESAVLAFCFAFLLEVCVLRFAGPHGITSRSWVAFYSLGIVVALISFLQLTIFFTSSESAYAVRNFSASERVFTQFPVLTLYLKQILLPLPSSMWFYYDNFPVSKGLLRSPETLLTAVLLTSLATLAVLAWRRWPLVTFGIGWFFLSHALTSSAIPLELAFEHRNYSAILGILIALAQPLRFLGEGLSREARALVATLPILGLATLCMIQAATWGDPTRLALALENRNPDSPRATYDLGMRFLLASDHNSASPTWSMAKAQFERSQSMPNASALPSQGLLLMHGRAELPIPNGIWIIFRQALLKKPIDSESLNALHAVSNCRIHRQCKFDDQELLDTFLAVMERNPTNAIAHTLYADFAWNVLGDQQLAIEMQRGAVALSSSNFTSRAALAKFLLATGDETNRAEAVTLVTQLRWDDRRGLHSAEIAELEAMSTGRGARVQNDATGGENANREGIHSD